MSDCSCGDGDLIQAHHILNLRFTLIIILSCSPVVFSSDILLEDDFSGNLSDNWFSFGDPSPIICDTMGVPAPSFNNNGDTMFNSGAISKTTFDYSEGLTLECDIYVTSNERGASISSTLALGLIAEDEFELDGMDLPQEITFTYSYSGEAHWAAPHLQGMLSTTIAIPDGEKDHIRRIHYNDYLDSWHRYIIILESDMTISFYIDSLLLYESNLAFPSDLGQLSVIIGNRSSSWGMVYHDNLILTRP